MPSTACLLPNRSMTTKSEGSNMLERKRNVIISLFRVVYFALCGYLFVYLSQGLYQNYVGSKVILTSNDSPIGGKGLLAPALKICAKTPFKNYSKAMFTLDEYMENSVNVTQSLLLDYSLLKFQGDEKPTPYVSCHKIFNTLQYFD